MFRPPGLRVIVLIGVLVLLAAIPYKDGPPLRHTGGFGEPTCHECHFDGSVDSPEAQVKLIDVPNRYKPDSTYLIQIALSRLDLGAGGFSMSTRFGNGRQAGSFHPIDDRVKVGADSDGVQFAMHTLKGTKTISDDSTGWKLAWTAPSVRDTVYVHLAANAANGDDSEFGDLIVTATRQSVSGAR